MRPHPHGMVDGAAPPQYARGEPEFLDAIKGKIMNCERCGANLALVGRVHRCAPRAIAADDTAEKVRGSASPTAPVANGTNGTNCSAEAARKKIWRAKNRVIDTTPASAI